jgi:hypothetical protein
MSWTAHGLVVAVAITAGPGAEPTPTPGPRTLGELACRIELEGDGVERRDGVLVITDESLERLGADAALTVAGDGADVVELPLPSDREEGDREAERTRWRQRYRRQAEVIGKLLERRRRLEHETHLIWQAPNSRRRSLRLDRARQELAGLDARLRRERQELARIVREARRHGAQPGWFRGLGPG